LVGSDGRFMLRANKQGGSSGAERSSVYSCNSKYARFRGRGPAMATRRPGELRRLISEAVRASLAERGKQMALLAFPPEGPPWPYIMGDKIATRVSREQGPLATSQAQLVRRLRAFRYPEGQLNFAVCESARSRCPKTAGLVLWNECTATRFRSSTPGGGKYHIPIDTVEPIYPYTE
jgi:hypothetical protein